MGAFILFYITPSPSFYWFVSNVSSNILNAINIANTTNDVVSSTKSPPYLSNGNFVKNPRRNFN